MPFRPKITSTMSAPLINAPTFKPATVSSVKLDGRNACRHKIRPSLMPLLFAMRM